MREHEVPTHVQAEDRVLLGFTFPQIVAVMAVCALSYGAYRYAPVGPSEVRMALAVVFGLVGMAMVVGKIGGRRLPLVAADLLKYRLGARIYAGPVSQLVRAELPAPAQPVKSGPGPLSLMAKRAGRGLARLRKNRKTRKNKERRNGRMRWFGKRRGKDGGRGQRHDHQAETLQSRRRKPRMSWIPVVALAVLMAAVVAVPQSALADDHEPWRDEIDFELTEPVEGRRIFVEALTVSGDRAAVTLRAATALDIRVRAFGGPEGTWLRFWGSATLAEGESIDYSLPLNGPVPSFTVSWEDTLAQAGALTFEEAQLPFPLPVVDGELCDLRVTSLGWTPGAVSGVVESECVTSIEHPVELQSVAGHESVTQTALMDAGVTAITGTVSAATGASHESVPFVPDGETRFTLPAGDGADIHAVSVDVSLEASLRIPIPPLTVLTHHPERTEQAHQDRAPPSPGGQRLRQPDGNGRLRGRRNGVRHRDGLRLRPQRHHRQGGDGGRPAQGARQGRDGGARAGLPHPRGATEPCGRNRLRRHLRRPCAAGARAGGPARRAGASGRAARLVRPAGMGVALVRRATALLPLTGAALVFMGAAPEKEAMLHAFDRVLTAMAYAGSGLCVFAIVWAGFILMAEGGEERGGGRAKTAVVMAVVGLVLVLSAKGVAALLSHGVIPSFPTP